MNLTDRHVHAMDCFELVSRLGDQSVNLLLTDPPYFEIVKDSWDNQWQGINDYIQWFSRLLLLVKPKMKPHGSIVFFGGIGKHGQRPLFTIMQTIEERGWYTFRNMVTWKKRRAYGKSRDYLFCREEILWYSVSPERTEVTFNIPLLDEKRGYDGWNAKYKAKSEFKRVSNVWDDIPELMRPERNTQKPVPLMDRLVLTHSNPGDLIVDPLAGWGTTGVSALKNGRRFIGGERIEADADAANERCKKVIA